MTYLLDTNVVSELRRRRPHPQVLDWVGSVPAHGLYLSSLVLGEIRRGVEMLRPRDPRRAESLDDWLGRLGDLYADRILPVSTEVAQEWGRMSASRTPSPAIDCLLAATAKVHGMTLVTRNVKDVARTGVAILNPFEPLR